MIKKAFILGAGLGTRLRPLTNVRPKPLVPLFRKPMMQYAMDRALELGIKDIAINTHHLAEVWEQYFPNADGTSYEGLNGLPARSSSYKEASVSLFNEPELLETGGGIRNISNWIEDESVLIYNGDIFCSIPLEPLVDLHTNSDFEATLILRSEGPAKHLAIDGNKIVDIHNKLGKADGTHQFTGIYAIKGSILKRIQPNVKESIIPAFLELAAEGKLGAVVVDEGEWFDLGTREMYLEAHASDSMVPSNTPAVDSSAQIASTAQINSSWICGGTQIGEGAKIQGSIIWDGVKIGNNTQISSSIIFSDVEDGAVLDNTDH